MMHLKRWEELVVSFRLARHQAFGSSSSKMREIQDSVNGSSGNLGYHFLVLRSVPIKIQTQLTNFIEGARVFVVRHN